MNRLLLFAIIFLSGCASLNKVDSTAETNIKTNEYTYSDPDSKIRYLITNDDKYLHIKLNTTEMSTITKIIKSGLKICFDVNGKKNDKVYFQYPLAQNQQFSASDRSKPGMGQPTKFDLNKTVTQIPNEALFNRNGVIERIVLSSTDSDIKVSIKVFNDDEIIYDLFIPINRISKEGLPSLSKLSLGFVSGKNESASQEGGRSRGSMSESGSPEGGSGEGGPGGGMSGGGRSGGGMSGGGRSGGGMSGGNQSGGMDRSAMFKPVEIWFKLNFHKV